MRVSNAPASALRYFTRASSTSRSTGSAISAKASRRSASARTPKVATAAASADSGPGAASAAFDSAAISRLRERRDELGHQLGLGGEIAVDGAGRDAGALGHRRDLHRRDAAFRGERTRRRQDRVVPRGKLALDVVGAAIGHSKE